MKEIKMSSGKLEALFETVKQSLSKYDDRPILKYIKIEVEGNKLSAVAVDGYMLSVFYADVENQDDEKFEFLIQPFYIPKCKMDCEVVFNCEEENVVKVTIVEPISKNKTYYEFNNGSLLPQNFINWKNVLEETDNELKIYVDARKLANLLKPFLKHHDSYNNQVELSFVRKNNGIDSLKPVYVKQTTKIGIEKRALVLPIRQIND